MIWPIMEREDLVRSNSAVPAFSIETPWLHHCFYEICLYHAGEDGLDIWIAACEGLIKKKENLIFVFLEEKSKNEYVYHRNSNVLYELKHIAVDFYCNY